MSYEAMVFGLERAQGRMRASWTMVWVLLALYLPQCWIFLLPGTWSVYRWSWIMYWPVMPGFLPGVVLGRTFFGVGPSDPIGIVAMVLMTLGLVVGGFLLARRGWKWRIVVCVGLFVAGVWQALALHGLYAA